MKKIELLLAMVIMFSLAIYSCATTTNYYAASAPQDSKIIIPDSSLPPGIKAFSGKWGGTWYDSANNIGRDAVLIVEKIDRENATVVYCWGDSIEWWRIVKGWQRYEANIYQNEGKTILYFGTTRRFEFFIRDGKLEGFSTPKPSYSIKMKRLP